MRKQTEKQFQAAVVKLAKLRGWVHIHQRNSIGTTAGVPDLELLRESDGRRFRAELKREDGKLTPAQRDMIDLMRRCGETVYVWRPSDWPAIEEVLK